MQWKTRFIENKIRFQNDRFRRTYYFYYYYSAWSFVLNFWFNSHLILEIWRFLIGLSHGMPSQLSCSAVGRGVDGSLNFPLPSMNKNRVCFWNFIVLCFLKGFNCSVFSYLYVKVTNFYKSKPFRIKRNFFIKWNTDKTTVSCNTLELSYTM